MNTPRSERLEAIRRQLEEQDRAWQRTKEALLQLGQVELRVPSQVLARIVGSGPVTPVSGVRA